MSYVESPSDLTSIPSQDLAFGQDQIGSYGFAILTNGVISSSNDIVLLTLNPQELEQGEDAATVVTPMQAGGKLRERRGNFSKNIVLSGTTGFRGGEGVTEFHELRSLFRRYWEIHRSGDEVTRQATDFLFYNPADDEIWIVEPLSFRLRRAAQSGPLRKYTINLMTIAPASDSNKALFASIPDPTTFPVGVLSAAQEFMSRLSDASAQAKKFLKVLDARIRAPVQTFLASVDSCVTDLRKLAVQAAHTLTTPAAVIRRTASTIDSVYDTAELMAIEIPAQVIESMVEIRTVFNYMLARPEMFVQRWQDRYAEAIASFATYETTTGLDTHRLTGISEKIVGKGDTLQQIIARAYNANPSDYLMPVVLLNRLRYPYISPSPDDRVPGTLAPGDTILLPMFSTGFSGDVTTPGYTVAPSPTYTAEITTASLDTFSFVDARWLTNAWAGFTIALLDGAGAGQERLIASNEANAGKISKQWAVVPAPGDRFKLYLKTFVSAIGQSADNDQLGTDLRLGPDGDLMLGADNDLATVSGIDNVIQACGIKMNTIVGELPAHPSFGLAAVQGDRASPQSLLSYKYSVLQTLMADPRIELVSDVKLKLTRDTGEMTARVKIRSKDYKPITVRF